MVHLCFVRRLKILSSPLRIASKNMFLSLFLFSSLIFYPIEVREYIMMYSVHLSCILLLNSYKLLSCITHVFFFIYFINFLIYIHIFFIFIFIYLLLLFFHLSLYELIKLYELWTDFALLKAFSRRKAKFIPLVAAPTLSRKPLEYWWLIIFTQSHRRTFRDSFGDYTLRIITAELIIIRESALARIKRISMWQT